MKRLVLLFSLAGIVAILAGCGSTKTPEEAEAAKYPQVQRLSPEKEKELRARAGIDAPIGAKGAPVESQPTAPPGK